MPKSWTLAEFEGYDEDDAAAWDDAGSLHHPAQCKFSTSSLNSLTSRNSRRIRTTRGAATSTP
jgi:hypothetical protein